MFKDHKRLAATDTLIGQGTLGEGIIKCEASLRIEGEYRGDIECKGDVVIGECGIARSNITAKDITIAGNAFGDIVANGRLILTSSGQLTGNITANALIIQEGGKLYGSCQMVQTADSTNRPQNGPEPAPRREKDSNVKETKEKSRQAG
ncbi:bactofilin family protein [Paenibacillus sp. sgz302251]|uniref:bactofilin family protein n=1 Tax=Paenibacillus sp. sgz302251 TaxID=3414493 RepID=UPI003C7C048E